jgi:hypothetical protein
VHLLVNKRNFNVIKMHGTTIKKTQVCAKSRLLLLNVATVITEILWFMENNVVKY